MVFGKFGCRRTDTYFVPLYAIEVGPKVGKYFMLEIDICAERSSRVHVYDDMMRGCIWEL